MYSHHATEIRTSSRSLIAWFQAKSIMTLENKELHGENRNIVASEGWCTSHRPTARAQLKENSIHKLLQAFTHINTPKWIYRHIKGYLSPIFINTLRLVIFSQNIRIVTDGSYRDAAGATGTIIETMGCQHRIILPAPVVANTIKCVHNDPYRCELSGILVGMYFVLSTEQLFGTTTPATFSCPQRNILI